MRLQGSAPALSSPDLHIWPNDNTIEEDSISPKIASNWALEIPVALTMNMYFTPGASCKSRRADSSSGIATLQHHEPNANARENLTSHQNVPPHISAARAAVITWSNCPMPLTLCQIA